MRTEKLFKQSISKFNSDYGLMVTLSESKLKMEVKNDE